jgi:hypothetical protein
MSQLRELLRLRESLRPQNVDNTIENVHAPKDLTTLERISEENHARRMLEEAEGDDDMEDSINISNEDANIQLDIETL